MKSEKIKWDKIIGFFVFFSLLAVIVFIIISIILAPTTVDPGNPHARIKNEYVLMLSECLLGIFAMLLPSILEKRLKLKVPSNMMIFFALFLYASVYLGEVSNFYYTVPHWDTILHTFSGIILGALGFSFINFFNNTKRIPINLSPLFVVAFAFCFAVTLDVLWEIYEFSFDGILGLNMQKFATESGEMLSGRKALADTMKDLIVDVIGALAISVVGYISLKYKKGWVEKLMLRVNK